MVAAPDPKALAAAQAEADALAAAEETRKVRESLVCKLTLAGQTRTLRFLDFTGLDARPLRDVGLSHNQLWRGLLPPGEPDLDIFLAGWWLAGRHDGLTESLPSLLAMSYEAATPGLFWPSDDEIAEDGEDDDSPPV